MTAGEFADAMVRPLDAAVEIVAAADPTLPEALVAEVVAVVAGARTKQRRLARALTERPAVLADGRSPAPRVVGDLLIALRRAGATAIVAPVCADCAKPLRSLQRRGEDWFCGPCSVRPERCSSCGQDRAVFTRDRRGRPRCVDCPLEEPDPAEVIVGIVTALDTTISAETVRAAVTAATSNAGQRRRLAWAIQDRPELLTGAGAEAPVPSVLRLIDRLVADGATAIAVPACPGRGRRSHARSAAVKDHAGSPRRPANRGAAPASNAGSVAPAAAPSGLSTAAPPGRRCAQPAPAPTHRFGTPARTAAKHNTATVPAHAARYAHVSRSSSASAGQNRRRPSSSPTLPRLTGRPPSWHGSTAKPPPCSPTSPPDACP